MSLKNQVRIIAGKWRGRKLNFPTLPGLRPTADRTKETLFNWLMPIIHGATCLDLFAGSGALGFEALSRGAKKVVFVDPNDAVTEQLEKTGKMLEADNLEVHRTIAESYIKQCTQPFDIVFIDAPFHHNLIEPTCQLLQESQCIQPGTTIFLEIESHIKGTQFPENFDILKEKKSGQVRYYLIRIV